MENMSNVKRRLITSMISILLLVITIFVITYAYFTSRTRGNTNIKSADVSAGRLELVYRDGNGLIELLKIEPGVTLESKTFTVTNTGTGFIEDYDVILEDVINELEYYEDLTYELTCNSSSGSCNGSNGVFPQSDDTIVTNSIDVGVTHTYTLTVTYNETNTDQSDDMNKTVSAKVNIIDEDEYAVYPNVLVYGNSIQSGTPTPEAPVEIRSVGDLVTDSSDSNYGKYKIPITFSNKNMLDPTVVHQKVHDYYSDINSFISTTNDGYNCYKLTVNGTRVYIPILTDFEENTQYTISGYIKGTIESSNSAGFYIEYTDGTRTLFTTVHTYWEKKSVVSTANKTVASFGAFSISGREYPSYIRDIQLEKGKTATTYQPYTGVKDKKYTIYLDEPLRKIGDYADYIDFKNKKVVRNVKNYNVNENTSVLANNSGIDPSNLINTNRYYFNLDDTVAGAYNVPLMCNMFKPILSGTSSNDSENIQIANKKAYFRISKSRLNDDVSVENLKRWVQEYPFYVNYPLATPIEATITMPSLTKIGATGNISVETTVQPSKIEIK